MRVRSVPAALLLAAMSSVAVAQSQAPGLWEYSVAFKSKGGEMEKALAEMQKQLAAMSPEERKAMEQAMAGRGLSMGPKGHTVKVCVTKEDAARMAAPQMQEPGCKQDVVQRSGSTVRTKWQCTGANPSSGEGEVTFAGDKAFTGKAVVNSVNNGKPETLNIDQSGKWLAADCGTVKPRSMTVKP